MKLMFARYLRTGIRPKHLQASTPQGDDSLFMWRVGYMLVLFGLLTSVLLAGCSGTKSADVDLGLKAKVYPDPSVSVAPAPSTSRKSDPPAPVTGD